MNKDIQTICPTGRQDWRNWLQVNHKTEQSVWVIYYKMKAGIQTMTWSEAVDEALCFGWIDSVRKTVDDEKFIQFFCKRKPTSGWSKINKANVQRLINDGMMTPAGHESIERAKQNGSWKILDEVEELVIPKDLEKAFKTHKGSKAFFVGLSKSVKKMMLQWIVLAKRPETRKKRIDEIVELAAQKLKPKQF